MNTISLSLPSHSCLHWGYEHHLSIFTFTQLFTLRIWTPSLYLYLHTVCLHWGYEHHLSIFTFTQLFTLRIWTPSLYLYLHTVCLHWGYEHHLSIFTFTQLFTLRIWTPSLYLYLHTVCLHWGYEHHLSIFTFTQFVYIEDMNTISLSLPSHSLFTLRIWTPSLYLYLHTVVYIEDMNTISLSLPSHSLFTLRIWTPSLYLYLHTVVYIEDMNTISLSLPSHSCLHWGYEHHLSIFTFTQLFTVRIWTPSLYLYLHTVVYIEDMNTISLSLPSHSCLQWGYEHHLSIFTFTQLFTLRIWTPSLYLYLHTVVYIEDMNTISLSLPSHSLFTLRIWTPSLYLYLHTVCLHWGYEHHLSIFTFTQFVYIEDMNTISLSLPSHSLFTLRIWTPSLYLYLHTVCLQWGYEH